MGGSQGLCDGVEVTPDQLAAGIEQGEPVGQAGGAVGQGRDELRQGAYRVVLLQRVLPVQDLEGEEPGRQVVQAGQGDAETDGVHVPTQLGDLPGQGAQLLKALQDEGVDLPVAQTDGVSLPWCQVPHVGDDTAQALAQAAQAVGQGGDRAGTTPQEPHETGEHVQEGDHPRGALLDPVHLGQDGGDRPGGVRAAGDIDPRGDQGGDLGGQGLTGEVHGAAVAQGAQLGQEGGLPGGGDLPAGGAGGGGGGLYLADAGVGGLDGVAQAGEHGQGAHREVAVPAGDDGGEDPVAPAV